MSIANSLPPDVLASIKLQFFQDCDELLAQLENGLLALQAGETDPEIINTIFRAAHSIKGSAASFAMTEVVTFAHGLESALAVFRSKATFPTATELKALLHASDQLADLVRAERDGTASGSNRVAEVYDELSDVAPPEETAGTSAEADIGSLDLAAKPAGREQQEVHVRRLTIVFHPHAELYAKGYEPLLLLQELARLGAFEIKLDDSAIPLLPDLNPDDSYLSWTMSLVTTSDDAAIREVFDFVEADCDLKITEQQAEIPPAASTANHKNPSTEPSAASAGSSAGPFPATIRINLERLDRLINLVSELVIGEAALDESLVDHANNPRVSAGLDDLKHITREIQENVMSIRAQPVRTVFQRMPRLVREVEELTGKSVRLVIEGEDTEIDRSLIEGLSDPLVHLLRNAIDHGIETSECRLKARKPAQGQIRLSAAHRAGRIVIEVADDGGGIDHERVRAIAVERGLVSDNDELTEEELTNLIFAPGFSTSKEVTNLSGRGVGMDVVKRSVHGLGGRISVSSSVGEGTTFTLSLPLTLAVLDGMMVSLCGESLIVPLSSLLETIQLRAANIRQFGANAHILSIHGSQLPLIDLGHVLGYRAKVHAPTACIGLLVEDEAGDRAVLLVDEILGQRQVVIKSLEANYRSVEGIAAATVLGNGRVALILDVNAITQSQRSRAATPARKVVNG